MHQALDHGLRRKPRAVEKEQKGDGAINGVMRHHLRGAARRRERGEGDRAGEREEIRVDAHAGEDVPADHHPSRLQHPRVL